MSMSARKVDLFGVGISLTGYRQACEEIVAASRERRSFAVSALATHGLVEAASDPDFRDVVNAIDLVTPDGRGCRAEKLVPENIGLD